MSITADNGCRDLLVEALTLTGQPLGRLAILELGNQRFKTKPGSGMRRLQSAGSVLRFLGATYQSIDLNGRDGATVADLGRPLPAELAGPWQRRFDVVTNFGTSEHVRRGQRNVFRTMHACARTGGLLVHAVPRAGTCARHGHWKYSAAWFRRLVEIGGYELARLEEWDKSQGQPHLAPGAEVYVLAILRRTLAEPRWELFEDPVRE